jgi:hypothetical protein
MQQSRRAAEQPSRIILVFRSRAMEAERVNQIASSLADLATRAVELRRYL